MHSPKKRPTATSKQPHTELRAPAPVLDFGSWIVFEDESLIAVCKPAGVLSQGGEGGAGHNLVDLARVYLSRDQGIGVLHRLDRNVSGLVLLAKQPRAASRLTRDFAAGKVLRIYEAIVSLEAPPAPEFVITARLRKNESTNEVHACSDAEYDKMPSYLQAEYKASRTEGSLTERWSSIHPSGPVRAIGHCLVRPITGRSHQLRVHLAYARMPIIGDPKYGRVVPGLARPLLHATRVEFVHPMTQKRLTVTAPATWDGFELTKL